MKTHTILVGIALANLVLNTPASGVSRYVDVNSANPTPPYTNWATAATNIQDAVDVAVAGDQVLVTNGVYQTGGRAIYGTMTNRVAVDNPIAIRSVNGPAFTTIQGYQVPGTTNGDGAIRCVYLAFGASLSGFALSQGATRSAGDQVNEQDGGGVWCASASAVVSNCVITGNAALSFGGGAYSGTLINCILTGNSAGSSGGAATATALGSGGGAAASTLKNCALIGNTANNYGGGAFSGALNNCTLTGNSAAIGGGVAGAYGSCAVTNCIVYYNQARRYGDNFDDSATLSFCCTTPLPFLGTGNLAAEPQLAGNWHLNPGSPCRAAGFPQAATGLDLDGEAWANPPSIGCDEYRSGSITGPLSVVILASYTNVAAGLNIDFQALISGRVQASRWDFGDGTVVSNLPYASHTFVTPGNYAVALQAYNESFPGGVSATVFVHVVTQPIHYVSLSSVAPTAPYTSWATAATNIQDAVDAASLPGALILVSNGLYETGINVVSGGSNRVAVTKPLRVESVNGPAMTTIAGSGSSSPQPVRCAYLTGGAMLAGFTLTNGATPMSGLTEHQQNGGAIYCEWPSAVVSNCVLTGNTAASGGGAVGGTLDHCTVISNAVPVYESGGGASGSRLYHCTLIGNKASWGGGASGCVLDDCLLIGNKGEDAIFVYGWLPFAGYGGATDQSMLNHCLIMTNSASSGGGVSYSKLQNCTLAGNIATGGDYNGLAGGGGAVVSTLLGCTLAGNSAPDPYSGGVGGGAIDCALRNCILYFNTAPAGPNYSSGSYASSSLEYCCTTPMPTNGPGNITNDPLFVDTNGWANLRPQSNSPCINAGNNSYLTNSYLANSFDLDGNARIAGATVDIGAYEFQSPSSVISYAWLQQYGLPTDGSADYADADNDGMNNWQEWLAGTIPTDSSSALRLLQPVQDVSGVTITWQSVTNRTYSLERTTSVGAQPFSPIADNIVGQAGTTSYVDTNNFGSSTFFYRVRVE
jgi:hypothetical protein